MSEPALYRRMRLRRQQIVIDLVAHAVGGGFHPDMLTPELEMAALAEEVRAYDREQRAAVGHEHLHEKVRDDAKVTFEICRRPNCTRPRPTLPEEASG